MLVYANAAGSLISDEDSDTLIGQSQVTVPFKGALGLMNHNQEKMFYVTVDKDILRDAGEAYEIRKDLQKGLYIS